MPPELHEGTTMRQVLKWGRKVRITFLPDNPELAAQVTVLPKDIGEKTSWRELLEKDNPLPLDIDIDAGITLLRFNQNMTSGTATFLPTNNKQAIIVNPFPRPQPGAVIPDSDPEDFVGCITTRTNNGTPLPDAIVACLPRLPK